jgi:hypothetical protein
MAKIESRELLSHRDPSDGRRSVLLFITNQAGQWEAMASFRRRRPLDTRLAVGL